MRRSNDSKQPIQFRIVSDSMLPLLKIGDTLELAPVNDPETLKRFDLLVFKRHNSQNMQYLCHFVWQINHVFHPNTLVTRSLKEPFTDELPTAFTDILGLVTNRRLSWKTKLRLTIQNIFRRTR